MTYELPKNVFSDLAPEQVGRIFEFLKGNPLSLLEVGAVRNFLAETRYELFNEGNGEIETFGKNPEDAAENTLSYSLWALKDTPILDRPMMLIRPLCSLEKIASRLPDLKVLSVGPRSEIEILSLISMGIQPDNISALDLISYSPWVQTGDMHNMPFEDNSFDAVILGWVFSYSNNPKKLVQEVLRVARKDVTVAISNGYGTKDDAKDASVPDNVETADNTIFIEKCQDILDYFPNGSVRNVYFRQDAEPPVALSSIVVFDLNKE